MVGENVVVLGEKMVGGGGGWVCCAVLCCAAAVYTPKASPKLRGRTEETEPAQRAAANLFPRVCAHPPHTKFMLRLLSSPPSSSFFTTKTTNSNHRLCRPTLELTPWRWRLRWTGRERIVTFKTVVARVVSSETAPMIR